MHQWTNARINATLSRDWAHTSPLLPNVRTQSTFTSQGIVNLLLRPRKPTLAVEEQRHFSKYAASSSSVSSLANISISHRHRLCVKSATRQEGRIG